MKVISRRGTMMKAIAVAAFVMLSAATVSAQFLIDSLQTATTQTVLSSDLALLDRRQTTTPLRCDLKPLRPELRFDLSFHTGFRVRIHLRDLVGEADMLTTVFRVIPRKDDAAPVHFQQKWTVPPIRDDVSGSAILDG